VPGLLLSTVISLRRFFGRLAVVVLVALGQPMAAFAHAGGAPLIHVPADHIEPGKMFQVIAADLGQNAQVTLMLAAADQTVGFGTITAGADGHFEATLKLPESFPDGYAELTASSSDGSFANAWVRVGTGPDPGVAVTSDQDVPLIDPSLILVPIGAVILYLAWRFWIGRSSPERPRRQRS
jgi:hypothetical protein